MFNFYSPSLIVLDKKKTTIFYECSKPHKNKIATVALMAITFDFLWNHSNTMWTGRFYYFEIKSDLLARVNG